MIGNDIIDVHLAEKESDWQRPGFLEKQFTVKEQNTILQSENPFEMMLIHWSLKESAYKIWVQQNQKRMFAPLQFECELHSETDGLVNWKNRKYYTSSIIEGYYIFTQATLEKETETFSWIGSPSEIEERLKQRIEEKIGIPASDIEKRKSDLGVPNYYSQNKQITTSCSISHHGNYGAFSILHL